MSSWLDTVGGQISAEVRETSSELKEEKTSVSLQGMPEPLVAVDINKAAGNEQLGFSESKTRADFLVFAENATKQWLFVIELKGQRDVPHGIKQLKITTAHLEGQSWIPTEPEPELLPVLASTHPKLQQMLALKEESVCFRGEKPRIRMLSSGAKLSILLSDDHTG